MPHTDATAADQNFVDHDVVVAVMGIHREPLTAAIGLADFYKWEYDYGHDLDTENAIIKIPGMNYQPPRIGSKQLLNFRATSLPAAGGIALVVSLALGVAAVITDWRRPVPEAARVPVRSQPAVVL